MAYGIFDMPKGIEVKASAKGIAAFPRLSREHGIVIGLSNTPGCRRVKWDTIKTPETLHMDFLEPLQPST